MIKVIRGHGGKGGVPISYLVPYKLFGILIYCVPPASPQPHGHVHDYSRSIAKQSWALLEYGRF